MTKKLRIAVMATVLISISFLVGRGSNNDTNQLDPSSAAEKYPFLASRLFIDNPSKSVINFTELREDLKDYYGQNNLSGSIYFEYLPTGTSIRIDGDNKEVAASLAKLPIAMLAYKTMERGQMNLDQEITLQQEWLDDTYGDLYKKGVGYRLTLRQAIKIMLSKSDNTALSAVTASLEGKVDENENPFSFMDADYQLNTDQTISIGARSYSSFLKCLYYSCYLNEQNSSEILRDLSGSSFDSRLVAGVGSDVAVAHKIGTFGDTTQSDCGIIYLDKKNYLLCIILDGTDGPAN